MQFSNSFKLKRERIKLPLNRTASSPQFLQTASSFKRKISTFIRSFSEEQTNTSLPSSTDYNLECNAINDTIFSITDENDESLEMLSVDLLQKRLEELTRMKEQKNTCLILLLENREKLKAQYEKYMIKIEELTQAINEHENEDSLNQSEDNGITFKTVTDEKI